MRMDTQKVANSLWFIGLPPLPESSEVKTVLQGSCQESHNGRPNSTQSLEVSLCPDGIIRLLVKLSITFSGPTSPKATSEPNAS